LDNTEIFVGLNEYQKEAITTTEGYVRVIAGAGSGKTKALTNRYAYIVSNLGIHPSKVLCVTFTNKAAQEMKNRVRKIIGDGYDTGLITTYHGFCVRVLREDINHQHYPKDFIILDNEDQKAILRDIYEELNLSLKYDSFKEILKMISQKKLNAEYVRMLASLESKINPEEALDLHQKIFLMYLRKQKKVFGLDFDDLINFTFILFKDFPDVLEKWQDRLHYIQVDEFQDSSSRQFFLVQRLSEKNNNLFVVGDPDQTIYEWRGARPEFLVDFDKTYPSSKTIFLNQNYRSTPEVLCVGNSIIKRNQLRVDKDMFTNNPPGLKVIHYHGKTEEDEAKWIADRIEFVVKNHDARYSDIAILYRAHYLSRYIEQGLIKAGISYTIYGGIRFFERKEIKDILAYLRLLTYGDDLSFIRMVNIPKRRIGKEKVDFLKKKSEEENSTLFETLKKYQTDSLFEKTKAKELITAIEDIRKVYKDMKVSDVVQLVLGETGYEKYLREDGDQDRLDNLAELNNSIVNYEENIGEETTLENYLRQIALYTDLDKNEAKNNVKLMTIHIAKGLEFSYVFLSGLFEGAFPNSRALESRNKRALEEERRLAYVAITRAMKELYLTESEGIAAYGKTKYPSRFIFEIKEGLCDQVGFIDEDLVREANEFIESSNKKLENAVVGSMYNEGDIVLHHIFGKGIIEKINTEEKTYLVKFDKVDGVKPISFDFKGLLRIEKENEDCSKDELKKV
jgi:DNA helicase-2/ATP-dependent DNA helicase PcrA